MTREYSYGTITAARFLAVLATVCTAWIGSVAAQDVLPDKVYRVTAYKKGDISVTSRSNYAEVTPQQKLYIPNAFTPNGDGINDAFGVKGEGLRNFTMRIFDRWGEIIFESDNPLHQWDGSYKGRPVQEGTYVYQVSSEALGRQSRTGAVTVVR